MVPAKTWARIASRLSLVAYTSVIPVHRLDIAIDYTLDESKTSRSQNADSLREAVDYALNRDKTEQDLFESALSCTCATAFEDMCRIKEMWHKKKGVQGFHLVQSFAAGEISPELAHQIGLEFAEQLLGGRFQAVVSTHLNTKCIHNHIVWNSVSIKDGKKYRSNEKSYVEQRPFKFFNVPAENIKEFAKEAKVHGLLYVPIRNKKKAKRIEVVVFADDASKIQRIYDNLGLDFVAAQAGEATIEKAQERMERLTEQMKRAQGIITEQLKVENALEWVQRMNNIRACAREIVEREIIYA